VLSRFRSQLTYANVVSTLCLFIVLGGSSYAAVTLKRNSVKSNNIAANAVTSPKVKNGSLLSQDFKAGQLPDGAKGAQGPPGATGAQGLKGDAGTNGTNGLKGDAGTNGTNGLKGDTGAPGQDGTPGTNGTNGTNGQNGSPGPGAVKLNVSMNNDNAGNGSPTVLVLAATNGYTISLTCTGNGSGHFFRMGAGGTGGAQLEGVKTIDDQPGSTSPVTVGNTLTFGGNTQLMQIGASNFTLNHYYRQGGTLVLHDSAVVTIVYDMFLDDRNGTGICSFRGTAVRAD
jgi:hypothetical protein